MGFGSPTGRPLSSLRNQSHRFSLLSSPISHPCRAAKCSLSLPLPKTAMHPMPLWPDRNIAPMPHSDSQTFLRDHRGETLFIEGIRSIPLRYACLAPLQMIVHLATKMNSGLASSPAGLRKGSSASVSPSSPKAKPASAHIVEDLGFALKQFAAVQKELGL